MYMVQYLAVYVDGKELVGPTGLPKGNFSFYLSNALALFVSICIVITIIYIVYAGIKWSMSSGDKQKIASAKARLTWAIIGLVIVLSAYFIVNLFAYVFKVDLLKVNF